MHEIPAKFSDLQAWKRHGAPAAAEHNCETIHRISCNSINRISSNSSSSSSSSSNSSSRSNQQKPNSSLSAAYFSLIQPNIVA